MASAAAIRRVAEEVAGYDLEERRRLSGIGPRRAEIIIAGSAVYAGLMVQGIRGFRYSPLGVRDGLLRKWRPTSAASVTSNSASNRSGSVRSSRTAPITASTPATPRRCGTSPGASS